VNGGGSGSGNPLVRTFTTKGLNTIVLAYTSTNGCVGYDTVVVKIEGPTANLDTVSVKPCIGEFYTFNLSDTVDVNKDLILFQFGPGIAEERGKLFANRRFPSNPNYPDPRYNQVKVTLESDNGCKHVINQEILLFETRAEFDINPVGAPIADSSHCFGTKVNFQNATGTNVTVPPTTITSWNWDFGIGSGIPPQYEQNLPTDSFVFAMPVLPDTTFEVTLIATNNRGCVDTVKHITEIYPLPSLSSNSFANCPGEADTLVVRNSFPDRYRYGTQFDWTYSDHITDSIFTDTSAAARIAIKSNSLDTTIIFNLTATNSKGCINTFSKSIDFHNLQAPDDQLLHDLSATYVIGYTYGLDTVENFNADQEDNRWVYNWEPLEDISCGNCPEPVISTMEDRTYTLTVADIYGCYNRQIYVSIDIEGKESLDVPGGFTPNEDGVNDVIYPDGHAIKEIVEFTVFNRFGNIVHSASGKIADVGWDGKIGGKVQTQDVYSYVVTANTYTGKTLVKRGKFSLIR